MSTKSFSAIIVAALLAGWAGQAQDTTPAAPATAPAAKPSGVTKHAIAVLKDLNLQDPAKEAKVSAAVTTFYQASNDWHKQNDAQLKQLWAAFGKARSKQNKAAADDALAKIDATYASFKPQHDQLLTDLATVLTPAQIETVEDTITVRKVEATYHAYTEIFTNLTPAQQAIVLQDLKAAREQAIDAGSMEEKSNFFKKYKIKIEEDYLTAQGYDPKQARKDFAARQKAGSADVK